MKKITAFLSTVALVLFTGCGNNKTAEVKKETIIVPAPANTTPEKGTVITLDKNGVKVSTKKVDIRVNPDKKNN